MTALVKLSITLQFLPLPGDDEPWIADVRLEYKPDAVCKEIRFINDTWKCATQSGALVAVPLLMKNLLAAHDLLEPGDPR